MKRTGLRPMQEMYYNSIELTAYRESTEPWRMTRLERVIGYVCALADRKGDDDVLGLVSGLHDHKGVLTVRWQEQPSRKRRGYFVAAWASIIGDGNEIVEHDFPIYKAAPEETAD